MYICVQKNTFWDTQEFSRNFLTQMTIFNMKQIKLQFCFYISNIFIMQHTNIVKIWK